MFAALGVDRATLSRCRKRLGMGPGKNGSARAAQKGRERFAEIAGTMLDRERRRASWASARTRCKIGPANSGIGADAGENASGHLSSDRSLGRAMTARFRRKRPKIQESIHGAYTR